MLMNARLDLGEGNNQDQRHRRASAILLITSSTLASARKTETILPPATPPSPSVSAVHVSTAITTLDKP